MKKNMWIIPALCLCLLIFPKDAIGMSVSASSAILMDQETGRVLYEHQSHEIHRIASITKVMTAILAIESGKLDDTVTVSKNAVYTEGSAIYLEVGEKITLRDLLYGLMLRSGNDAAVAIAEHVGGSEEGFVFLMNQKAAELGMTNSVFSNPHGLDDHEEHYSTAYDMAILTRYAMLDEDFRTISGTKVHQFKRESMTQKWTNKNRLLTEKYEYSTGGKTGFTKRAGRTLISTAQKKDEKLIAVTLNAPSDWNDHISMFEHGFRTYDYKMIVKEGELSLDVPVKNKQFYVKKSLDYTLAKDESKNINIEYKLLHPKTLEEMDEGVAGEIIVHFQDELIKKEKIFLKTIETEEKWWEKMKNALFSKVGS